MAKETAMLIFTDSKENNNKFYELILNDDDTVFTRWGRVGADGQSKTVSGGSREFNKIMNSKIAKGYVRSKTIAVASTASQSKSDLQEAAKRDLLANMLDSNGNVNANAKVLHDLVERLTQMNRHQIMQASNGNIQIDDSGLIKTPLGLVTDTTIVEAREILEKIENYVTKKNFTSNKYTELLETYLKLIPQKVPSRRGWGETFFTDFTSLSTQNGFLDQLEGSLDLYKTKEKEGREKAQKDKVIEKVFNTKLDLVKDKKIIGTIQKFFDESKNSRHVSASLKLKNVYEVANEDFEVKFQAASKKLGNIRRLWHGTRAFNVLSILKGGLIIPKSGGNYHITGRMFGDGVYFSDQSTKSLNYSYGYWDGGAKDDVCFMFLADVVMGKEYTPKGPSSALPMKGYDSTFAKANLSGVMNNEMIVYSLDQFQLRYLCEFSSK